MAVLHPLLHRTVAGYRLTEYIGSGGMGEVFKAYHPDDRRPAAVKVLYRPEFAARFRNEATVQGALSHPNITLLLQLGALDDRPALVMEWVEGQPLEDLIRRKERLSNEEAGRIVAQLADAVAYLHRKGIIHRDLKPSNVRIDPNGNVKLLDFGIAREQGSPRLTQEGYVVGTTEFMAPEQFQSRVEAKSDVWALGVILYEMTTGYLPFDEKGPLKLRKLIERSQYTDPRLLNPSITPRLAFLIAACLQLHPAKRPTAQEVSRLLARRESAQTPLFSESLRMPWIKSLASYWPVGLLLLPILGLFFSLYSPAVPLPESATDQPVAYERIRIEVVNADYDVQLVMPDGTLQQTEPFLVERRPGQALPITIRHEGSEQKFIIDPGVKDVFQCYFDR